MLSSQNIIPPDFVPLMDRFHQYLRLIQLVFQRVSKYQFDISTRERATGNKGRKKYEEQSDAVI